MKLNKKYLLVSHCYMMLTMLLFATPMSAQDARFTVVLDAGHGGHDPGAQGSISREKDINLAVTLDLGAIIEQKYQDVKVVYSRKTDKYLTLQERADVVNSHHADLFICIHTNASQSSAAYGAETFTLGVDNNKTNGRTKGNLEVAMRENSVITLEENYKTKYQGFDPNSVDSYIMFEFMQNRYIDRSVNFASVIQKQFRSYCSRFDRGVQQASFWVLYRSACPSVLVELGFISNPAEERYLSSDMGQKEMATAIFNAFVDYKRDHDKKSGKQITSVSKVERPNKTEELIDNPVKADTQDSTKPQTEISRPVKETPKPKQTQSQNIVAAEPKQQEVSNPKVDLGAVFKQTKEESKKEESKKENNALTPVFKVQLFATVKSLKSSATEFKGVKNTDLFEENGLKKYTVGSETDYAKIEKIRAEVLGKFPEAFIIAFLNGKKMSAKDALKLINK